MLIAAKTDNVDDAAREYAYDDESDRFFMISCLSTATFAMLYVGIYLLLHRITKPSSLLSTWLSRWVGLPPHELLRIAIRIIGPIHALYTGIPSMKAVVYILQHHIDDSLPWPEDETLKDVVSVSIGYMIVDTVVQVILRERLILLHHILTLFTEIGFVWNVYQTYVPSPYFATAVYMATELSVPFLHTEFLLRKLGVHPTSTIIGVFYTVNLLLIPFAWILFRIWTFLFLFSKLYSAWGTHRFGSILIGEEGWRAQESL
eukprot:gene620-3930_t